MKKPVVPSPSATELEITRHGMDLSEQVERAVIDSDEAASKAATLLSMIKQAFKKAEEERKEMTDPLNAVIKNINARSKSTVTGPLEKAEAALKAKMGAYMQKRRAEAEAEAERQRKLADKAAEKGKVKAAANAEVRAELATIEAQTAGRVSGIYGGSASLRKRWTFEITDGTVVPREYTMIDAQAVRAAIAAGVRDIPCIRIYQEESLAAR
jgi:type IV secretory pathway VirB10-like protein